jgi:hypothetical protein
MDSPPKPRRVKVRKPKPAVPKKSKIELFKELGNYNKTTCSTRVVNTNEFVGKYTDLKCGNGGSWCRRSAMEPNHKAFTVNHKGRITFHWNQTDEEEILVRSLVEEYNRVNGVSTENGNGIRLVCIIDKASEDTQRPIRDDIRKAICSKPCVVCVTSKTVCDHKNDLYNDPRVLNTATQVLDDFQPLCNHCNLQKRQVVKETRATGKRYSAKNIPIVALFDIDFISGTEEYDSDDPNAMVGTFWYDPVAFMSEIKRRLSSGKTDTP